jgi:RND family efflux transporter MFP subunit
MKPVLVLLGRITVTAVTVIFALIACRWLWVHYREDPWTRDARVRADVAQISPDVGGFVTEVDIHDNSRVKKGQILFVVDRPRYQLAVEQADANLAQANATLQAQIVVLAQARRDDARNHALGDLASTETVEQGATRVAQLQASINQLRASAAQAKAARDTARLNLDRTMVYAPVDGVAADVQLRPGDYLTVGKPAFGVVDANSLHVDGYFEETKLGSIRVGDHVTARLMGDGRRLEGHVESISPGIEDRERTSSGDLLVNVNPTFDWVRLAQRIPVRIHIDQTPADLRLIAGRTATVTIHPNARPVQSTRDIWP